MTETRLSSVVFPGVFRCLDVLSDGEEAVRLKRMGICCGRLIQVVQVGDPMVIVAVGARVGVSRKLANSVVLEPVEVVTEAGFVDPVPVAAGELCGAHSDG
ncbi:MAG: ferrous iron transport protein A [Planctomycetaceae bacterium]